MNNYCRNHVNQPEFPQTYQYVIAPWGGYWERYRAPDNSVCFKTLIINPGQQISVQTHELRDEVWYIPSGINSYELTLDQDISILSGSRRLDIRRGTIHSIKNLDVNPLIIHEMQIGICKESDIVRIYDPYNREPV